MWWLQPSFQIFLPLLLATFLEAYPQKKWLLFVQHSQGDWVPTFHDAFPMKLSSLGTTTSLLLYFLVLNSLIPKLNEPYDHPRVSMCPCARPHGPTHLLGLLILTANIPEVEEEAIWFLDYFLAKERVQKLVAVQARALNVGHLGRQSWLGCIWLCSPCKQRVHAHFLLLLNIWLDCISYTHIWQVNTGLPCPLWALGIFCTYNSDSVSRSSSWSFCCVFPMPWNLKVELL